MAEGVSRIKRDVLREELALTRHAVREALEEEISTGEIREAILSGSIEELDWR